MDTISYRDVTGMDKSAAQLITRLLVTGLTILLIFGMLNFATTCDPAGVHVVCGPTKRVLIIVGAVACGIALALDLVSNPLLRCLLDMIIALMGLFVAIAPGRILPLCADATSFCNTKTHPFAIAVGVGLFIMANADCVVTFRYAMRVAMQAMRQQELMSQSNLAARRQENTSSSYNNDYDKGKYKG